MWLAVSAVLWLLLIISRLHACCLLLAGSSAAELDFLAFVLMSQFLLLLLLILSESCQTPLKFSLIFSQSNLYTEMLYKFALFFVVSCVNYVNYLEPESLWKWAHVLIVTIFTWPRPRYVWRAPGKCKLIRNSFSIMFKLNQNENTINLQYSSIHFQKTFILSKELCML